VLVRLGLAALAGLALSLAFEPVALPWVIPFAVAAFALVMRGQTWRRGLLLGAAFGAAFYPTHIVWMQAVGVPAWIALSALETAFYALAGAAAAIVQRQRLWPVWFAAVWTTAEVVRSGWPLGGMPWGRLAFAVIDTPAAPALPYVGAVGVSFTLALISALLAAVLIAVRERASVRPTIIALAAVCAALAIPVLAPWHSDDVDGPEVTVAVVQGDVPGPGDDILFDFRGVTQNHVDATVDLAVAVGAGTEDRPDFVLWPENSTATDPFRDGETNAGIRAASSAIGVPILVGAIVDGGPNQVLNQGIVWQPDTGAGERYTKLHPVPFGEYIPARAIFLRYNFFDRLRDVGRDMLPGSRTDPLLIGGVLIADAICFDVAYDDGIAAQVRAGAEILVVQTSNATFIHTDQIDQQFAISRVRALESGRWTAVASTNGVTGVIAPDGRVVASAEPRTQRVLVERLARIDRVTPAHRMQPWVGPGMASIAIVGLVLSILGSRRARRSIDASGAS
jgi:apolipoprotein N-acyltransferase